MKFLDYWVLYNEAFPSYMDAASQIQPVPEWLDFQEAWIGSLSWWRGNDGVDTPSWSTSELRVLHELLLTDDRLDGVACFHRKSLIECNWFKMEG